MWEYPWRINCDSKPNVILMCLSEYWWFLKCPHVILICNNVIVMHPNFIRCYPDIIPIPVCTCKYSCWGPTILAGTPMPRWVVKSVIKQVSRFHCWNSSMRRQFTAFISLWNQFWAETALVLEYLWLGWHNIMKQHASLGHHVAVVSAPMTPSETTEMGEARLMIRPRAPSHSYKKTMWARTTV